MTEVRMDTVALRAFQSMGVDVAQWIGGLRRVPINRKGTIRLVASVGNLCREIVIGASTPDRHDLDTYYYFDDDPPVPGTAVEIAGRIESGTLPIGPEVRYLSPGRSGGRERETGWLLMGQVLPETMARALVGLPATAAVGSPLLEGLGITGFDVDEEVMLPDGGRQAETRLHVEAGWTRVEIGDLPETARRK